LYICTGLQIHGFQVKVRVGVLETVQNALGNPKKQQAGKQINIINACAGGIVNVLQKLRLD